MRTACAKRCDAIIAREVPVAQGNQLLHTLHPAIMQARQYVHRMVLSATRLYNRVPARLYSTASEAKLPIQSTSFMIIYIFFNIVFILFIS